MGAVFEDDAEAFFASASNYFCLSYFCDEEEHATEDEEDTFFDVCFAGVRGESGCSGAELFLFSGEEVLELF